MIHPLECMVIHSVDGGSCSLVGSYLGCPAPVPSVNAFRSFRPFRKSRLDWRMSLRFKPWKKLRMRLGVTTFVCQLKTMVRWNLDRSMRFTKRGTKLLSRCCERGKCRASYPPLHRRSLRVRSSLRLRVGRAFVLDGIVSKRGSFPPGPAWTGLGCTSHVRASMLPPTTCPLFFFHPLSMACCSIHHKVVLTVALEAWIGLGGGAHWR